jgi:farnesyl-diphosphate farnesyltransferase
VLAPRLVALLRRVSRSFYLSVRVLPGPVQAQVALGYLLARAADTVADTPLLPPVERSEVLAELGAAVAGKETAPLLDRLRRLAQLQGSGPPQGGSTRAEQELLGVLGECLCLLRQLSTGDQQLLGRVLLQLIHGMSVDLARFPAAAAAIVPEQVVALESLADLDEYTYYAAGCVGEFWTDLMALHVPGLAALGEPELRQRGVKLGKALQLVNVLRDAPADLRAGRCYWPTALLAPHGLSPIELARLALPSAPPPSLAQARALRAVAAELGGLTLRASEAAWPYVQAIPADVVHLRFRLACAWPLLLALATLARLRLVGSPLLSHAAPVKVTRGEVYALIARSSAAALLDARASGRRLDEQFAGALARARGDH